jgi:hypothetical protein
VVYAADVIRRRATARSEQADDLFLLSIFGGLAYRNLNIRTLLGREIMMDSPIYREAVEEGRLHQARADVLDLLEVRFGSPPPPGLSDALGAVEDETRLRELHRLAALCTSPDEVVRALATPPARPARRPRSRRRNY